MSLPVKEILKVGERMLEAAQIEDAKLDSQMIYCHLFQVTKSQLIMEWQRVLEDWECDNYFQLLDRRRQGEPLQYITGEASFLDFTVKVEKGVLIPRRDTENLIVYIKELLKEGSLKGAAVPMEEKRRKAILKGKALDLCCGSGILGIGLNKWLGIKDVTFSDINSEPMKLTRENCKALGVAGIFKEGDLFQPFRHALGKKRFDLIISNPPYIATEEIENLDRDVKDFEPLAALDGGKEGMEIYENILEQVMDHLTKQGLLALEIGHDQGEKIKALGRSAGFTQIHILPDLENRPRVAIMWK